jgi:type II secretory pathway pseudopilin PulG
MHHCQAHFKGRAQPDGGFTIVETVMAISILLIVTLSVMGTLAFATATEATSVQRQKALDIANQRIDTAKAMTYGDIGVVGGNPPGAIQPEVTIDGFLVETAVQRKWEAVSGTQTASTYKTITVTVSWQTPRYGHVTVDSAIFGRDSFANVSDLVVHVVDGDDGNAPMAGAIVAVDPNIGAVQTQYADSDGTAGFGRLPSGLTAVNVDFTPYIFDVSPFTSLSLVPGALTEITISGWKASDVTINVHDASGNDVAGATVVFDGTNSQTTDSSGAAFFGDLLPNGLAGTPDTYGYQVTVPGYSTISGTVPAFGHGDSHITVQVTLPSVTTGRLIMKVYSTQTGQPLAGATVTCSKPTLTSATTDANGEVSFTVTGSTPITGAVITPTLTGYTGSAITTTLVPGVIRTGTLPMTPSTATSSLRIYTQKSQNGTYVARGPYWIRIRNVTTGRTVYRWVYPYTNATTGILVIPVPAGSAYQCEAYAMRHPRRGHGPAETPTTPWRNPPTQRTARATSAVVSAGATVDVYIRW